MRKILIAVGSVMFLFFCFSISNVYSLDWEVEKINSNDGGWPCLVLDSNNRAHISSAYTPGYAEDLVYNYFNGSTWQRTVVDNDSSVGMQSSIALDSNGYPHISHYEYSSGADLKYSYFDGTRWYTEELIADGGIGIEKSDNRVYYPFTNIAVDSFNRPHIAYKSYYLYKDSGIWNKQQVANLSDPSSLRLDSSNRPHMISYNYYVWFDGTSWQSEKFTNSNVDDDSSMRLDSQGNPRVVYYDTDQSSLYYAYRLSGVWYYEQIPSTKTCRFTSLALDNTNSPHISFYDAASEELIYAYKQNNEWQFEVIKDGIEYYDYYADDITSSIALDSQGRPHLAFHGESNELWYAKRTSANYRPKIDMPGYTYATVDRDFQLVITANDADTQDIVTLNAASLPDWLEITQNIAGNPAQLTLAGRPDSSDADINSIISVSAVDNQSPSASASKELNVFVSLDWAFEHVDSLGDVGAYCSSAIDSQDKLHVSYYDAISQDLKYAYFDGALWNIQTIDSQGDVGKNSFIAIDSQNYHHISYFDDTNDDLKYAYFNGTTWQVQTVDSSGYVGSYNSIAMDSQNRPHISYYNYTNNDLKYAYFNGTTWQVQTVDSSGYVGNYNSIAADSQNHPHISYYDDTNDDLKYAYFNGEQWVLQVIDRDTNIYGTSIAVDKNSNIHIVYDDYYSSELKYAFFDNNWQIEVVYDDVYTYYSSLSIDDSNNPHIIFSSDGIHHILKSNSVWSVEKIFDIGSSYYNYTSIAIDSKGTPHVLFYYDDTVDDLIHAYRLSSNYSPVISNISDQWVVSGQTRQWTIEARDPNPEDSISLAIEEELPEWLEIKAQASGNPASITLEASPLAVNVEESPRFTFTASDDGVPMHSANTEIEFTVTYDWGIEIVTKGSAYLSLDRDKNNGFHISSYDYDRADLKYSYFDGQVWQIQTVDSEGDAGRYTSMAVDSQNHPHISYTDNTNNDLKYASFDGVNWQTSIADANGGYYSSLAFDSSDFPHIAYETYDNGYVLKHAYFNGTIWQSEKVDSVYLYGNCSTSIQIDSLNRPHIAYFDYNSDALKYAYFNGSTWQINTVDSANIETQAVSLALDSSNRPHIAYYVYNMANGEDELKYAYFNGSSWKTETVGPSNYVSYYISIAVDSLDRPHISYPYDVRLYYAYKQGSNWQIENVDSDYYTDLYSSLVLDDNDMPYIAYSSDDGIRFARRIPAYAPIIESFSPQDTTPTINEGESLEFSVIASDGNGDALSYFWKLDGNQVSVEKNYIYSPSVEDAGQHNIDVVVTDPGGLMVSQSWNAEVIELNHPPEIKSSAEGMFFFVKVGEELKVMVNANDIDNDAITLTAENLPAGAQLNFIEKKDIQKPGANVNKPSVVGFDSVKVLEFVSGSRKHGVFSWIPDETQISQVYPDDTYTITFKASDGKLEDEAVIYVWVYDGGKND